MKRAGVLFALPMEARPFIRLLDRPTRSSEGICTGFIDELPVSVAVSGMGPERAASAALNLLSTCDCSLLIASGYAGALDDSLRPGDTIICKRVIDASCQPTVTYEPRMDLQEAASQAAKSLGKRSYSSTLVSVTSVASRPSDKLELAQRFAGTSVDMESGSAARVAHSLDLPFIAVRAILDGLNDTLPEALAELMAPDGSLRLAGLPRALISNPSCIYHGIALGVRSNLAAQRLASLLQACIPVMLALQ